MQLHWREVIRRPVITEKSSFQADFYNQYTFVVDRYSDKLTIKASIEYLFDVKVTKVNTCHLPKKKKRVGKYLGWKSHYKKAIVTLSEGDTINLFAEEN